MKTFKNWLISERDIFGFERVDDKKAKQVSEDPINPLSSDVVINELSRFADLNGKYPFRIFEDSIQWGTTTGALRLDISPLGSYKAILRRMIPDIKGESTWVCKRVFDFHETDYDIEEIPIAHKLFEIVQEIESEGFESAFAEFPKFDRFVSQLHRVNTRKYPAYCMFPMGMKKMSENYYKTYYEFRGHGVEAPNGNRAEQFDIDVFWDKEKGLIRCWGYEILSKMSQHTWQPQPSEWDELFSPIQSFDEITKAINTAFMTY